jgi:hypothetical protein
VDIRKTAKLTRDRYGKLLRAITSVIDQLTRSSGVKGSSGLGGLAAAELAKVMMMMMIT